MSEHASDVQVLNATLIEHARARAGEHPGTETLAAYLTDGLAADAEARVRDHLVGCRSCTAELLELETLARPEVPREGVVDLATAAAWREVKSRLFTPRPAARPAARWQWPHAVAAAALLATVGLSGWVAQLRGSVAELSRPQSNLPLAYLGEVVRSDGEETIEVPAGAARYAMIFNSPELGDFERYEVRFFDTEGAPALHVDGLVLSDSLTLRLGLARGNPPAGRYRVEVRGFDGERWQTVEEHWRRIVYL